MAVGSDPRLLRRFVGRARSATLATIRPDGNPRLVPICFVLDEPAVRTPRRSDRASDARDGGGGDERLILYSAIDEKPKRSADPLRLARVRDILERPAATVLVDRWHEDWGRLAWVRLDCRAEVLAAPGSGKRPNAERTHAIADLRAKYPQYQTQRLEERPLIRLTCAVGAAWGDFAAPGGRAVSGPEIEPEPDVEAM